MRVLRFRWWVGVFRVSLGGGRSSAVRALVLVIKGSLGWKVGRGGVAVDYLVCTYMDFGLVWLVLCTVESGIGIWNVLCGEFVERAG